MWGEAKYDNTVWPRQNSPPKLGLGEGTALCLSYCHIAAARLHYL